MSVRALVFYSDKAAIIPPSSLFSCIQSLRTVQTLFETPHIYPRNTQQHFDLKLSPRMQVGGTSLFSLFAHVSSTLNCSHVDGQDGWVELE